MQLVNWILHLIGSKFHRKYRTEFAVSTVSSVSGIFGITGVNCVPTNLVVKRRCI